MTQQLENPLHRLSPEQIEAIGKEFDAIHEEVYADLGERDAKYIHSVIKMQRRLELIGRAALMGSSRKPLWALGTVALSLSKILDNMEIGHNVMHGQWDWMRDPEIHSTTWDWDSASSAESWKHSHNYVHHTYTNIRGKDRDLGYDVMRIDANQPWHPVYLFQPIGNIALMLLFQWGVALHDLDLNEVRKGRMKWPELKGELKKIGVKARKQFLKDYVAFPAITGPQWKTTATANMTANLARNVWSNWIIFCGHFPDGCYTFSQEEVENESRGGWYVRQLVGAANIDGSPLFHLMSGNLSFQVEHHLFPDIPSTRYAEVAPRVREICERYELPYNTGPFFKQWGEVQRTILRMSLPGGKPRQTGEPYRGDARPVGDTNEAVAHNPLVGAGA